MGNKSGKGGTAEQSRPTKPLSPELQEKVVRIFKEIDIDKSGTIDKEETIKWWNQNFARINTNALFDTVDINNDGEISEEEWIEFWMAVADHRSEEEINEELDNLLEKGSWTNFDVPQLRHPSRND